MTVVNTSTKDDAYKKNDFGWIIKNIINNQLCSGCGTCVGVCPRDSIDYRSSSAHNPTWKNENNCIKCGLCVKVCPGKGYSIRQLLENYNDRGENFRELQGYYEYFAHGYSNNINVRKNGSSGGVATELLKYLITQKKVDKVIVVQLENSSPTIKITDDLNEIEKAQQSKYCPVPLNSVLKDIINSNFTYALVGTPCQIAGQFLAENEILRLRNKIKFKIGLFCGYVQTPESSEKVKESIGIKRDDFADWELVGWRNGDYPGYFTFKNKNTGEIKQKYLYEWLNFCVPFYSLKRCFLCPDGNNELADIVLGDVHAAGTDENCIICRTKSGDELLKGAQKSGNITMYKISEQKALNGTIGNIVNSKRKKPLYNIEYLKEKKEKVPSFDISFQINKIEKLISISQFRLILLFRTKHIKNLLSYSPSIMEKVGSCLYTYPSSLPGYELISKIYRRFVK